MYFTSEFNGCIQMHLHIDIHCDWQLELQLPIIMETSNYYELLTIITINMRIALQHIE